MSELEHWSAEDATEAEARLLDAARGGGPSHAARARIALAVGVGAGASLSTAAATAKSSTLFAGGGLVGKSLAIATIAGLTGIAVWQSMQPSRAVLAGTVVTSTSVGTSFVGPAMHVTPAESATRALHGDPATSDAPRSPAGAATRAPSTAPERVILGVAEAPTSSSRPPRDVASQAPEPPRPTPTSLADVASPKGDSGRTAGTSMPSRSDSERDVSVPSMRAPVSPVSPVDAELSLLESAKDALNRHRPDEAIAMISAYERAHPHGVLVIEARVIRIEALVQRGHAESARKLGEAFLRAYPNAPQAPHVARLVRADDVVR